MRIGISTSVIQRGKTGVAEYVFSLIRAFVAGEESHRLVLFVLEEDLPLFEQVRERARLVPVAEKFRPPIRDIFWHQTVLPGLAREHQLDVLHVPSYRRMLWSRPCPLVATVHDLAAFRVARKYDWKRMFYGRVIARRLAGRQDGIIAISRNTARDIETFWKLPGGRMTVIHQGVDHQRFQPLPNGDSKSDLRHQFDLPQPFFLYVSRLEHPAKNHVRLIKAFERFKSESGQPWKLVLAGSDWHGAGIIHAAVRSSPVRNDIHCLGFVSSSDLPGLYRAAGVTVYPSLYEGFGIPPLEAMACGCPVLCSTRGALGEVVGNAAATVNPDDIAAMACQLFRLAADEPLRQRLSMAGLSRAREFDWKTTASRTLEVYARAIEKVRGSSATPATNEGLTGPGKRFDFG